MPISPIDVVTGGGGFIGSHLVEALLAAGRRVRVIDNFSTGRRTNLAAVSGDSTLEIIEADINDAAAASEAFEGGERVFHLAALADIVPSINHPGAYFDTNAAGTMRVVEMARAKGVRRLIYAASSSCYGIASALPTPETAPLDPMYPYALTKLLGEQIVLHWGRVYGLGVISLRLFNVYGPRSRTTGAYGAVFGVFLAQLLARTPLTVVGDGSQTRDFVFVEDVVRAFLAAGGSSVGGEIFNVGAGKPVSINHLVKLLGARDVAHLPKRPGEPDCTHADITKISHQLGWRPEVSFEHGVKIMLDRIENWRDAPVWTPESIATATSEWFKLLGGDRRTVTQ